MYLKGTRLYSGQFLTFVCTIGSRYIAVEYNTILNKIRKEESQSYDRIMNKQKKPIPRPDGRAMGRLFWVLREKVPRNFDNILYCGERQITVTDTQGVQQSGKRQGNTRLDRSQQQSQEICMYVNEKTNMIKSRNSQGIFDFVKLRTTNEIKIGK